MSAPLRRLPATLWLVALWVALWGRLSAATVLTGAAVAVGVQLVLPRAAPGPAGAVRPLRFAHFLAYFVYKLIEANVVGGGGGSAPPPRRARPAAGAGPRAGARAAGRPGGRGAPCGPHRAS
jgi:hypothetical protein